MKIQNYFKYEFFHNYDQDNFFVNSTNKEVYETLINPFFNQNIFVCGPEKSGKSHLINIWKLKNNAIIYKNNFNEILNSKKNVAIDNLFNAGSEESLFHIINHCKSFNLKILATSSNNLNEYNFHFKDLYSRLRTFYFLSIKEPDDEMCKILMTKLFYEKQIIVKNKDIFNFIFYRINRTYNDIFSCVEKIDKLSLEKKRELTIPLIREIL